MKYGIATTNFDSYSSPLVIADLAARAERAGWDGFFVWDHAAYVWDGRPTGEPWMLLAAAAATTTSIKLGPAVSPIPRYHPALLAGIVSTLDHLTGGRVILGAAIGARPKEFEAFGGEIDARARAAMTDEGLDLISDLWSGETVNHAGVHFTASNVVFAPVPVQRPRVPIWIGGNSTPALRRAARWDGWIADTAGMTEMRMTSAEFGDRVQRIREWRDTDDHFDLIVSGYTERGESDLPREFADAGANWWLESVHDVRGNFDDMGARIDAGPPERSSD